MTVASMWKSNPEWFESKRIEQIVAMCGDGRLTDGSAAQEELRAFLTLMPLAYLSRYADECLVSPGEFKGVVLQDIVNQVGERLGFKVDYGRYKGKKGEIGFDGLWQTFDGQGHIITEVKTSDVYRINLDTLAGYRIRLADQRRVSIDDSSILIVVGRDNTGDLEAQIRGSRHAWDIRVISVDALMNMARIAHELNDATTIQRITKILQPLEYTKVDGLIDLMFEASQDIQSATVSGPYATQSADPAQYHEACAASVSVFLGKPLIRRAKTLFSDSAGQCHVVCVVSKQYKRDTRSRYWYAFHPSQRDFLDASESYIAFGCGTANKVVVLPASILIPLLPNFRTTTKKNSFYWHVEIFEQDGHMALGQSNGQSNVDVTQYVLKT